MKNDKMKSKTVKKKVEAPKTEQKVPEKKEAEASGNFWGKLGGWVKEKVDCCLEG